MGVEPSLVVLGGALARIAGNEGVLVVEDTTHRDGPVLEVAHEVSGGQVPPTRAGSLGQYKSKTSRNAVEETPS